MLYKRGVSWRDLSCSVLNFRLWGQFGPYRTQIDFFQSELLFFIADLYSNFLTPNMHLMILVLQGASWLWKKQRDPGIFRKVCWNGCYFSWKPWKIPMRLQPVFYDELFGDYKLPRPNFLELARYPPRILQGGVFQEDVLQEDGRLQNGRKIANSIQYLRNS